MVSSAIDITPPPIRVPANVATPERALQAPLNQALELNAVNNLTGGRRSASRHRTRRYPRKHRRGLHGGSVTVPQIGPTCSSGDNCPGAQNASLIATMNQSQANSVNDNFVGGGHKNKKRKTAKRTARKNTYKVMKRRLTSLRKKLLL
jgi:hypothetical protein